MISNINLTFKNMNYSKLLLLSAIFITSFLNNSNAQTFIKPDNSLIRYSGRVDFKDPKAPTFSYSGTSIKAKFEGTSITALFNCLTSNNYFFVIIDNDTPFKVNISKLQEDYLLAEGLSDTAHIIEIFKLTEANQKTVTFRGMIIGRNKSLLTLPTPPARKIEYIGNSITCGYGNETLLTSDGFKPDQENHYYTYAAYTSRDLNAQHMAVCFSGKGVYRNYDGPIDGSFDNMPSIYHKIDPNISNAWDFNKYQSDVICINLGTNDFSGNDYDTALYKSAYRDFLTTLRGHYPSAKLVCLVGPMLGDSKLSAQKKILNFLVDEFNTNGDNEVYFFEMSKQTGAFGYGGDYHPTVEQHKHNGKQLTEYLSQITGWAMLPVFKGAKMLEPGNEVQLSFNTKMSSPEYDVNSFSIMANNIEQTTIAAMLSSDSMSFILELDTALVKGDKIKISYTKGTVVSAANYPLDNISNANVTNSLLPIIEDDINNNIKDNDCLVFPNPSKSSFKISKNNNSEVQIALFNTSGQLLFKKKITASYNFGDQLSTGIYILKTTSNTGVNIIRLIKE